MTDLLAGCQTTSIPIHERDNKWLTIVVEAECFVLAQSRDESDEHVKVALTIKVTPRVNVTIQQRILDKSACRTSVKAFQTMHITRNRNANSNQHQISGSMQIYHLQPILITHLISTVLWFFGRCF